MDDINYKTIEGKFAILKNGIIKIGKYELYDDEKVHIPVRIIRQIIEDAKKGYI